MPEITESFDVGPTFLTPFIEKADTELFHWVNGNSWHNAFTDGTMILLSSHATWAIVLLFAIAMAAFRRDRGQLRFLFLLCLVVALVDSVSGYILKPWIGRLRPCHALNDVVMPLGKCGGLYGFPSNHALNAGTVLGILVGSTARKHWPWILGTGTLVLLVGLSRIWLGVHYPLDVTAGMVLGTLTGYWASRLSSPSRSSSDCDE